MPKANSTSTGPASGRRLPWPIWFPGDNRPNSEGTDLRAGRRRITCRPRAGRDQDGPLGRFGPAGHVETAVGLAGGHRLSPAAAPRGTGCLARSRRPRTGPSRPPDPRQRRRDDGPDRDPGQATQSRSRAISGWCEIAVRRVAGDDLQSGLAAAAGCSGRRSVDRAERRHASCWARVCNWTADSLAVDDPLRRKVAGGRQGPGLSHAAGRPGRLSFRHPACRVSLRALPGDEVAL